jgi:hypothetical protein
VNFTDITTDSEYLIDVGMGPETHPHIWRDGFAFLDELPQDNDFYYSGPPLGIGVTDPARKWELLANVLTVIGAELDRRGWEWTMQEYYFEVWDNEAISERAKADLAHIALLKAYHAAVKAGESES